MVTLCRIKTAAAADKSEGCSEEVSEGTGEDDTITRLYVCWPYI